MTISDPIADMLTRIRNAAKAKFSSVDIPGSSLKTEVAKVLRDQGFIRNYKFIKDDKQGILRLLPQVRQQPAECHSWPGAGQPATPAGLPQGRRRAPGAQRHGDRHPLHLQGGDGR